MQLGDRAKIRVKQLVGSPLVGYQDYQVQDVDIWATVTQMESSRFTVTYDEPQNGYKYQEFPFPIPEHIQIHPSAYEWVTLEDLRTGAIFVTKDGIYAVKSEYYYSGEVISQSQCILLASGEFAHFPEKNKTLVREVKGEWTEDEADNG